MTEGSRPEPGGADPVPTRQGRVKCVVWDLDNTLWDGVLLEDSAVTPRAEARAAIETLDRRGILNSIASRNDHDAAMDRLSMLGLADYFLYPQINWNPKSTSVQAVATRLNIGLDALAFVDDQPFERDEVAFAHPQVLCVDPVDVPSVLAADEFNPRFVTEESRARRSMYRGGIEREQAEQSFVGTSDEFLASLRMVLAISPARTEDLRRAEELTVRTNQLNSTGITYSYEELEASARSPEHLLLVAGLTDRYGSYGTIGLALVEQGAAAWTLKLLLMSCRVAARGVGGVLLGHIARLASQAGARLEAEFIPTGRNRPMYVTYRFLGFEEAGTRGDVVVLAAPPTASQNPPSYLQIELGGREALEEASDEGARR